jgi:hypothetical protein
MSMALIPGAQARDLMQAYGKKVSAELAAELTRIHEAGHAVVAELLRGFECDHVSVDPAQPSANTPRTGQGPEDNQELVDLAGLYAELRWVKPELGYSYAHLKNATYDLDRARGRLTGAGAEVAWALTYQPLAQGLIEYLWDSIRAVAGALGTAQALTGAELRAILATTKPVLPAPAQYADRMKPEYLVPG